MPSKKDKVPKPPAVTVMRCERCGKEVADGSGFVQDNSGEESTMDIGGDYTITTKWTQFFVFCDDRCESEWRLNGMLPEAITGWMSVMISEKEPKGGQGK